MSTHLTTSCACLSSQSPISQSPYPISCWFLPKLSSSVSHQTSRRCCLQSCTTTGCTGLPPPLSTWLIRVFHWYALPAIHFVVMPTLPTPAGRCGTWRRGEGDGESCPTHTHWGFGITMVGRDGSRTAVVGRPGVSRGGGRGPAGVGANTGHRHWHASQLPLHSLGRHGPLMSSSHDRPPPPRLLPQEGGSPPVGRGGGRAPPWAQDGAICFAPRNLGRFQFEQNGPRPAPGHLGSILRRLKHDDSCIIASLSFTSSPPSPSVCLP